MVNPSVPTYYFQKLPQYTATMNKIVLSTELPAGLPISRIFDPIVDLLIENGNELAESPRLAGSQAGFSSALSKPLDLNLIEATFVLPESTVLNRQYNRIYYRLGEVSIVTLNDGRKTKL